MRTVATKKLSRFQPQLSEKSAAIVVAAATTTAAVGPKVVSWKMDGKQCVFTQSKLYKMKVTRFSFSVCPLLQMLLECFCQSCQQCKVSIIKPNTKLSHTQVQKPPQDQTTPGLFFLVQSHSLKSSNSPPHSHPFF